MAVLELKYFPADVLRTKTAPVVDFDEALAKTVDDMAETMYVEEGIGLAANQVGISKQMFVMDVPIMDGDKRTSDLRAIINPEIIDRSGEIIWQEGCLSFPGIHADVKRAARVVVRYQNVSGDWVEMEAEGLAAVCIQHEMDHLAGITFVEYLSPLKRKLVLRELKKTLAEMGVAA